jgi:anti-sigma regulatory factor (Ser/Thr protein kinase)
VGDRGATIDCGLGIPTASAPAVDCASVDRQARAGFGAAAGWEGGSQTLALIEDSPAVRLELDSLPECVTLVRSVLAALGDALALEHELLDDLKTAISEACNNVVVHAYGDEPGPMFVELAIGPDRVEAVVRDHGDGIKVASSSDERMGVGLAVISALANRAEFISEPGGGTTVRMSFAGGSSELDQIARGAQTTEPPHLSGDVVATVTPVSLLAGVLGRAARATAARAHFTVDRFSELGLVTDALGAQAEQSADGAPIGFSITSAPRRLELAIGPLRSGTRPTQALELLADELKVEPADGHELIRVVVTDSTRSTL